MNDLYDYIEEDETGVILKCFHMLKAYYNGDESAAEDWFFRYNDYLEGTPLEFFEHGQFNRVVKFLKLHIDP